MKKIVLTSNHQENIGNMFFVESLARDLERSIPKDDVFVRADIFPIKHNLPQFNKGNCLDMGLHNSCDVFLVPGPVFSREMPSIYKPYFDAVVRQGGQIGFISAGSMQYDREEIEICRSFLSQYPIFMLSTRDEETYNIYGDLAEHAHKGICSAFFVSKHFPYEESVNLNPYVIYGFETKIEPTIEVELAEGQQQNQFLVTNTNVRDLGRLERIVDGLKTYDTMIGQFDIIRLIHVPMAGFTNETSTRPGRFSSLNPFSYLQLLANTEATFSDRVHACVPTLSYGKPAQLFNNTKRSALFSRVGLSNIGTRLVKLNLNIVDSEHKKFTQFLRRAFS